MEAEYLIVGSGLTGAVIARTLADAGRSVFVMDRRAEPGGNVHDHLHPSGIRIHTYGPHYFRTNHEGIWSFVNRFSRFHKYEAAVKSRVDDRFENWPVTASYIRRVIGEKWRPEFKGRPTNLEQAALAMMPRVVYEKFVKGYNEKQWGVPAHKLSVNLARRFDVQTDDEVRLTRHKYQGIPADGYAQWMRQMLAGIQVELNVDYLKARDRFNPRRMTVFTGAIDEYFGCDLGPLKYCSQRRTHEYLPAVEFAQPCGQVNNPDPANGPHIRTLEWKHMMPADALRQIRGTVVTREIPFIPSDPNQYEYPFPDDANQRLYQTYRARARAIPNLLVCGRLGEYRYYDMDQAIGRALMLAGQLIKK